MSPVRVFIYVPMKNILEGEDTRRKRGRIVRIYLWKTETFEECLSRIPFVDIPRDVRRERRREYFNGVSRECFQRVPRRNIVLGKIIHVLDVYKEIYQIRLLMCARS